MAFATQQSIHRLPRHAEHGARVALDQVLEQIAVQTQQFRIAQRTHAIAQGLAAEQAHLAHAIVRGNLANQVGGAVEHAQAAAAQQIQRLGYFPGLEQVLAAGQADPAQVSGQRRPLRVVQMRE